MSVARCPYLVVAVFQSREVAEQLASDFKKFYSSCFFEVVEIPQESKGTAFRGQQT